MTAMPEGALPRGSGLPLTATLGALGVMYGDIGTCPLYALKEAAKAAAHCRELTHDAIFGTVSLILWALILFISLKYALLSCARTTAAEAASLFFWHCFRPATPNAAPGGRRY